MFTRSLPTLGLAVVLALLGARSAAATTLVVPSSSQDAFIRKNAPNRIAGANPTNQRIRVQASPPNTQVWRGLVQFSLGGDSVRLDGQLGDRRAQRRQQRQQRDADARPASHHGAVAAERGQMEQRAAVRRRRDGDRAGRHRHGLQELHGDARRASGGEPLRRRPRLDGQGRERDGHQRHGELRVARGRPPGAARQAAEAHRQLHAAAVHDQRRLRRHQLLHHERAVRRAASAS